jgi:hypothetical protein
MVVEKDLDSKRAVGRGVDEAKARDSTVLSIGGNGRNILYAKISKD